MKYIFLTICFLFTIKSSYGFLEFLSSIGKNHTCDYIVQPHDTIITIKSKLGQSTERFIELNKDVLGKNLDIIIPGTKLKYYRHMCYKFYPDKYHVKKGETLSSIAQKLGIHPAEIVHNNSNVIKKNEVKEGMVLYYLRIQKPPSGRGKGI